MWEQPTKGMLGAGTTPKRGELGTALAKRDFQEFKLHKGGSWELMY